ncbi:hypothetical protein [Thermacetogenium phaeum]|nr:hypothetical protein [Thermacetogenium phaeum]
MRDMSYEEKFPEKQILDMVDRLAAIIGSLRKKEYDKEKLREGHLCTQKLLAMLEQLIGSHEEYLKEAVKELVRQRMSGEEWNPGVENILDDFYRQVRNTLDSGPQPDDDFRTETAVKSPPDKLGRAINYLFPRCNVIKGFRHRDRFYQYYLPELNLAVLDCSEVKSSARKLNRGCSDKQAGIRVVAVDCRMLPCSREIARAIKRQVDTGGISMLKSGQ